MTNLRGIRQFLFLTSTAMACLTGATYAQAATWSDTSLGYRYGNQFAEPYNSKDISKSIISLTHASGFAYGKNFFNADILLSDSNDPAGGVAGKPGAQEVYVVYRNTLDIGKLMHQDFSNALISSVGWTNGFDLNSKNDFYASKKRMLVTGPTLSFKVPKGFVDLSVLALFESNSPSFVNERYRYKTHPAVSLAWGLPLMPNLSLNGYAAWIASKGNNESGKPTAAETHLDTALMYDVGSLVQLKENTFRAGLEYEYWHNKFGNRESDAGPGATASTPMVRVEYHF